MKTWIDRALAVLLCVFAVGAFAEETATVVNLIDDRDAPYAFAQGAPLLEIVFPRVYSSDCAILRMEGETMMIDASTEGEKMQGRIATAMGAIGMDHIDIAYNSYPHRDHINGFAVVGQSVPIGEFLYCFPEDHNEYMTATMDYMKENGIPARRVDDGDVLTLGESGLVTLTVIRREGTKRRSDNDKSAMLMIQYGERRFLMTADNESLAQKDYTENPPACGLDADILKYPHHGLAAMNVSFFEAVSPEICVVNCSSTRKEVSRGFLRKQRVPRLNTYNGLIRMRTDGQIWVIDYLYEPNADRNLPYTSKE